MLSQMAFAFCSMSKHDSAAAAAAEQLCLPADEKYKMDLSGLTPFIKTVAIQYCNEHAPKPDAPQDQA